MAAESALEVAHLDSFDEGTALERMADIALSSAEAGTDFEVQEASPSSDRVEDVPAVATERLRLLLQESEQEQGREDIRAVVTTLQEYDNSAHFLFSAEAHW